MKATVQAVLLIGPTGSGKTPLGEQIEKAGISGTRCFHFDFGRELRRVGSAERPPEGFTDEEHSFIRSVLEQGLLLEDEHFPIAEKIISSFLTRKGFSDNDLLVLNGLPRHEGQARQICRIARIRHLIVLDCGSEDVCRRIDANTGGDRADRSDDSPEMVRKKMAIFRERTAPLIRYFSGQDCRISLIPVTAACTGAVLYARVEEALREHAEV